MTPQTQQPANAFKPVYEGQTISPKLKIQL